MHQTMEQPAIAQETKMPSSPARVALKIVLQVLLLGGSIFIIYLPPVRDQLGRIHEISDYLIGLGWIGPLIFIPAVAVLVAVGVPRLFLCPIGGLAFGFWKGLIITQLATVIGFYGTFLFVRWSGRDMILRKFPRLKRYTEFSRRSGIITVLLIRQLPITGFYINLMLGLLPLSHADFLLGTLIGILPEAIPATLAGSSAVHISSNKSIKYTAFLVTGLVILWTVLGRIMHKFVQKQKQELALDTPLAENEKTVLTGDKP